MKSDSEFENNLISRTGKIRRLLHTNERQARTELIKLLCGLFDIKVEALRINHDQYSLNSMNGFFQSGDEKFFFKFHQEDGEEDMEGEYYRAEILSNAGLPVDIPVMKSSLPGEQILVYPKRDDKRFSDILFELDRFPNRQVEEKVLMAERNLNSKILEVAIQTLHPVNVTQVRNEPIHHLFYDRMINLKSMEFPGGRYKDFYVGKDFQFPNLRLTWEEFSRAGLVINGQKMKLTFAEIFDEAFRNLNPKNLTKSGGFVAHGDAHNANIWFESNDQGPNLCYFDPAFAGKHIPSLLAEAKATFHNIFAHPLWLYDSDAAASTFDANVYYENNILSITTNWALSSIREKLLEIKINFFWKPLLEHLNNQGLLPFKWHKSLRSALAMCPALVMNLRGNVDRHNQISSAIAFSVIALCGSEPEEGSNIVTDFFRQIDPLNKVA